jgi:hypothetical protein
VLGNGNQHHTYSPLGRLPSIETEFAQHVSSFLKAIHPAERNSCEHIIRGWAKLWGSMPFGCAPVGSFGAKQFVDEAVRSYRREHWRRGYMRNREAILARQRLRRQQKKTDVNESKGVA